MRITVLIFCALCCLSELHAQVDLRRVAVTPEQDSLALDSTFLDLGIDANITSIEITGNFSGKIRLYGTDNANMLEAYHVFSAHLRDNRARGLREISSGTNDNTGVGLHVEALDGVLYIRPASDFYKNKHFAIYLPHGIPVTIKGTGYGGKIIARGIDAPLYMRKIQASVRVENPKQYLEVETQRNIEVVYNTPPSFSASLTSHTGLIDISIPQASDVVFELRKDRITPRIFTDLNLRMTTKETDRQIYQLNDGVNRIDMYVPYGNVYIRSSEQAK